MSADITMEYRRLGATGLRLSAVSLGTWATVGERLDYRQSLVLLDEAYQVGVNFFDCAETYADGASEEATGRALKELGLPRETYVLSSKVFWGVHGGRPNTRGLSRKHVVEACHAALRRLRIDYLDLYLCHRPDPDTPLEETVRAMSDLVRQGKILYWGTSEWAPENVRQAREIALAYGDYPPVLEQLQYNIFHRDRVEQDYADLAQEIGLGITAWSPLAHGLLAGRYDQGLAKDGRLTDPSYAWLRHTVLGDDEQATLVRAAQVNTLAIEIGVKPAALALAWVLRNAMVATAICGASTPDQLRDSRGALEVGALLDEAILRRIDRIVFGAREAADDGGGASHSPGTARNSP